MKCTLKRTLLVIGGLLLVPWSAAQAQTTIRMEAEDMTLDTYKVEVLDFASNSALINLKGFGYVGSATAPFPGGDGVYDITVVYHDENDGLAQLSVSIDGTEVDSWTLDFKSTESQPTPANRLTREIATGYTVNNGDEIRIDGLQGNWDHANVDYIEFVGGGGGSTGNLPIVLDFSGGGVSIDQPGYYILDRDWETDGDLSIDADDVTVDLRGFTLELTGFESRINADWGTSRLTLKNGTISESSGDGGIFLHSSDALLTGLRIERFTAFGAGNSCRLENSVVVAPVGIAFEADCIVLSNHITAQNDGVYVGDGALLVNNQIQCEISYGESCINAYRGAVIARNIITHEGDKPVILLTEGRNEVLDNLVLYQTSSDRAIVVNSTGDMLRGNILRPYPDTSIGKWNYGIVFLQDGNYYGDNLISAQVPFELGGTTQVNLGGNQGL